MSLYDNNPKPESNLETTNSTTKDECLNCKCKNPKPDKYWRVGEYGGRYNLCLNCGKRIWK